jgi:hypothetical protein
MIRAKQEKIGASIEYPTNQLSKQERSGKGV